MNLKKLNLALCWLLAPSWLFAADQQEHQYTDRDKISFSDTTEAAFDRSGRKVTHTFSVGGALLADHHGTMGNVTVARIDANGNVETLCTHDRETALDFMSGHEVVVNESSVELHLEER